MEYITILAMIKWDSLSEESLALLTSLMNKGDALVTITEAQFEELLKEIKKG